MRRINYDLSVRGSVLTFGHATRIMGIVIVVEKIAEGKPPRCDRIADLRTIACQLILVALHVLPCIPETEVVRDVKACQVRLGSSGGHSRQFAVGGIG